VIGLAALWVRANRRVLSRALSDSKVDAEQRDTSVEIHTPSPRVIQLEPRRSRAEG
jgi:hypothetical protein